MRSFSQLRAANVLLAFLLLISPAEALIEKYLYRTRANHTGDIIIDHYVPDGMKYDHPDFLYQEDFPYHRVVEFYSPTCPHCQKFAPHYIEFATKFTELTKEHSTGFYENLDVKFYAVSCKVYRDICKKETIQGYPSIKIYKANSNKGMLLKYWQLHPQTVVKMLGIEVVQDDWKEEENHRPSKAPQPVDEAKPPFLDRRPTEVFGDAYLSFHEAMKTAVFLEENSVLAEDKITALKKWLTELQMTLPPWRIQTLLEALLGGPTQNFTASIEKEDTWQAILDRHPPRSTEYSAACQLHESPYTCGLWTLFHIMSVGVVEFNRGIIHEEGARIFNLEDTTKSLRDFVQHFLLCEVCTDHFLHDYDTCQHERCNRFHDPHKVGEEHWRELPFWLLETHNAVNVRLQSEQKGRVTTAREQQTVMWPPVSNCPQCWPIHRGSFSAKQYNQTMMYNYLRLTYWPQDTHSETAREDFRRLQNPPKEAMAESKPLSQATTSNGSPKLDSMAATSNQVQYSLVFVLIMAVAILFNKHWFRQKPASRKV